MIPVLNVAGSNPVGRTKTPPIFGWCFILKRQDLKAPSKKICLWHVFRRVARPQAGNPVGRTKKATLVRVAFYIWWPIETKRAFYCQQSVLCRPISFAWKTGFFPALRCRS